MESQENAPRVLSGNMETLPRVGVGVIDQSGDTLPVILFGVLVALTLAVLIPLAFSKFRVKE